MDQAKRELIRAWLIKARNDLVTARALGDIQRTVRFWNQRATSSTKR